MSPLTKRQIQSLGLGEAMGLTSPGLSAISLLWPGIGDPATGQFHLSWESASWLADGTFSLSSYGRHTHIHTHTGLLVMKPRILLDQGPTLMIHLTSIGS